MGKASKWFRGLLGLKKSQDSYSNPNPNPDSSPKPPKHKRRWSFVKSYREDSNNNNTNNNYAITPIHQHHDVDPADPTKRAIAVAAATAAVAEAAVAAAQAAAVVVRLTSSSGRCAGGVTATNRQEWAAVKIQAAFRGCLARRALRALKGLVKLQALVRGRIERKRTAEELKRMQALLRAQSRARAGRPQILHHTSNSSSKSSSCHLHGPATPDKFESPIRSKSMKHDHSPVLKRNSSKSCVLFSGNKEKHRNKSESHTDEQSSWTQERSSIRTCSSTEKSDSRNLEVDSGKSQVTSKRRNLFPSTSTHNHAVTVSSDHYNSKSWSTTKDSNLVEESQFFTAENSPQFLSASSNDNGSKNTPFTPNRSEGSRSYFYGYSDYPSYMAYTESSKAKVRSLSAPKQRPHYERTSSSNRYSLNGFGESKLGTQRVSTLQSSFTSKAYPGSGRLDKLGMPVGYRF